LSALRLDGAAAHGAEVSVLVTPSSGDNVARDTDAFGGRGAG